MLLFKLLVSLCGVVCLARGFKFTLRSWNSVDSSRARLFGGSDNSAMGKVQIAPFDCIEGAGSIDGPLRIASLLQPKGEQGEEPAVGGQQSVSFTVFGDPIPLARHRTVSGGLRTYNPSSGDQKKFAKACMTAGVLPSEPLEGPVEAVMTFYFQRPKSHYRTGKFAGQLKEGQDVWHSKKKDLDNLVKFVLDSLNSVAYVDDGQVCAIKAMKLYTEDYPRSEIIFRQLPDIRQTSNGGGGDGDSKDEGVDPSPEHRPAKSSTKAARKKAAQKKEASDAAMDVVVGDVRGRADIYACSS